MKHLNKFNEGVQSTIKDTLNSLRNYFITDGVYTSKLLDHMIDGNRLLIELDVQSAYKEGSVERTRIKYYLKRGGFEPSGNSVYVITLSVNDLEWVRNFFSRLK